MDLRPLVPDDAPRARQTGFRRAEVSLDPRDTWGKKHISFANLTWRIGGRDVPVAQATPQLLETLTEGDYAVLVPPPSKADQFGLRWGSRPIWLPFHPTCLKQLGFKTPMMDRRAFLAACAAAFSACATVR